MDAQKSSVESSLEQIEAEMEAIRARAGGRALPRYEQSQLDRLEQQVSPVLLVTNRAPGGPSWADVCLC